MTQKMQSALRDTDRETPAFYYKGLLANLDRELSIQQALLQLLEDERSALAAASTGAIEATNARKETLLFREKENSAEREDMLSRLSALQECGAATLSELASRALDERTAVELRVRQHALAEVAQTVHVWNRRNRELIEAAMTDIQGSLKLIRSMVSPPVNYRETGQYDTNAIQGTLLNREG